MAAKIESVTDLLPFFRQVIESSSERMAAIDSEGTFILLNQAYEDLIAQVFGIRLEEGVHGLDAFSSWPALHSVAQAAWERALCGETFMLSQEIATPEGALFQWKAQYSPIHNHLGQIIGVVQVSKPEIPLEEVLRAQGLKENEARYQRVVDGTNDGLWDLDHRTGVIYWSRRCHEQLDVPSDFEVTKDFLASLIHPDDVRRFHEMFQGHMERDEPYDIEFRLRNYQTGEYRWYQARAKTTRDENGNPLLTSGLRTDIHDRKVAEEELRESEWILRTITDVAPSGLWMTHADGKCAFVNRSWEQITGMTIEESCKVGWDRYIHPEDRQRVVESFQDAARQQQAHSQEFRALRPDGLNSKPRWVMSLARPRYDLNGQFAGYVGANLDITEQKETEQALRDSEARFRRVVESGIIGIVFWNRQGEITDANEAFLQMVGYTREELEAGQIDWHRMTPTEYRHLDEIAFQEMAQAAKCMPYEKQYFHKNGNRVDILLSVAFYEGTDTAGVAYILDITDRKNAVRAIQESEARFRTMAESTPVMIWVSNAEGRNTYVNPAMLKFFGVSYEEMLGLNWQKVVHPDDQEAYFRLIETSLTKHQALETEVRVLSVNDEYRWILVVASPRYSEDGSYQGLIGSCVDLTERKQAEEALRLSEERLNAIYSQTSVGIALTDFTGRFLMANQRYCDIVGRSLEALQAITMQDMTHPVDLVENLTQLSQSVQHGSNFVIEKRYIKPDGSFTWVRNNVTALKDGQGKPYGILAITEDINEWKKTEQALHESESRFRNLADTAPLYMAMADESGNAIYFNKPWQDFTGKSLEELSGFGWLDTLYHEDRPKFQQAFMEAFTERKTINEEYRFIAANGEVRWMMAVGAPRFSPGGEFLGYFGTYTDIDVLKRAEQAMRESESKLRKLVETNVIGVIYADPHGRISNANNAFLNMTGYSREELEAGLIRWQDMTPPEWLELDQVKWREIIEQGECTPFEKQYYHRDGHRMDVLVAGALLDTQDPMAIAYVLDITERKQFEKDLKKAKSEAEEANRNKSEFLAKMSHELRTPLNAIIGYSDMMKKGLAGELNSKQERYARNISTSGRHLLSMVNDILDISKIEAGKMTLMIDTIPVQTLVGELRAIVGELATEKEVHLWFEVDPALTSIHADSVRLKQIFFNLISNGIKFNQPNGEVFVRIYRSEDLEWLIGQVQDTGVGIPEDKIQELFSEFYQVENTSARSHEGTGLGLALTRHLVELHGGSVSLESKEGEGSTFTFQLPFYPLPV